MSEHVLSFQGLETTSQSPATGGSSRRASAAETKTKRGKSIEYRALFLATFAVFLVAAIAESLIPRSWPNSWKAQGPTSKETIWRRASVGAQTCVAYAFMG